MKYTTRLLNLPGACFHVKVVVNRNKRGNYVTRLYEESSLSNLQVASPTAPGWQKYTLERTVAFKFQRVIGYNNHCYCPCLYF